jgi:hypothetical protein
MGAAIDCGPIEITIRGLNQSSNGIGSVRTVKGMEATELARRGDLVYGAKFICIRCFTTIAPVNPERSTTARGSVKIAILAFNGSCVGQRAVLPVPERIQGFQGALGCNAEDRPKPKGASEGRGAVKLPIRGQSKAAHRGLPICPVELMKHC